MGSAQCLRCLCVCMDRFYGRWMLKECFIPTGLTECDCRSECYKSVGGMTITLFTALGYLCGCKQYPSSELMVGERTRCFAVGLGRDTRSIALCNRCPTSLATQGVLQGSDAMGRVGTVLCTGNNWNYQFDNSNNSM